MEKNQSLLAALNKLGKWRMVFAGWQLGTRTADDPECKAVRDHREVTILLRAEANALLHLLLEKKVITLAEWEAELERQAALLDQDYQKAFPGFRATDSGISVNTALAKDTMSGWRP
jgi:hypothetical protein